LGLGVFVSVDYILRDVHGGNVLKDSKGRFYYIDVNPSLNTKLGGTRKYGDGGLIYRRRD